MEKLNFAEKLYYFIKKLVNKITYSQDLFDDEIWQIRFSKSHQTHTKYKVDRGLFNLSIRNSDDVFKYLLWVSLAAMLMVMVHMSRNVGVSTREIEQNHYSELVYNHFHKIGDVDAYKAHPYASTQAQYVDIILYSAGKTLNVSNIFLLKHLVSAIFGWLLIVYLSVLILRAFSWRAAFFTAFFLFISPRFIGYSVCNVVDVTFAFGFVFTITQMYYFCRELPVIRIYRLVKIVLGTLLALSTYNAGFILINFFNIFVILNYILYNPLKKFYTKEYLKPLGILCLMLLGFTIVIYTIHSIGTLFLVKSTVTPKHAFELLTINYPTAQNQLFEGHIIGPDNFPKHYLPKYLFVTIPTIILISFVLFFVFFKTAVKSLKPYSIFIILYPFFYCIHKVRFSYLNPDTMWAIYYCIYPLFMLIAVSGIECTLRSIYDKYTNFVVLCLVALLSFMPIRHILFNQPFTSLYFNEISGGIPNAYAKYELNIPNEANKQAFNWMKKYLYKTEIGKHAIDEQYVVATNVSTDYFAKDTSFIIINKPYSKADTTWDYYIAFCQDVPAVQLRNGTWPVDSVMHAMKIDSKPIVAFYKNSYREQLRLMQDSIAAAEQALADSIAALEEQ